MTGSVTLYVVRHAEQLALGDADDPELAPVGRAQAALLGRRFVDVPLDAVHHSPQRRAAETAHLVAQQLPGTTVVESELLRDVTPVPAREEEVDWPLWLRRRLEEVPAAERDLGGQGLRRAVAHFSQVEVGQDRHLLLVTHAFVVSWFVRHALDAPSWRWAGLRPAPASVTVVHVDQDHPPVLLTYNDVAHLHDL